MFFMPILASQMQCLIHHHGFLSYIKSTTNMAIILPSCLLERTDLSGDGMGHITGFDGQQSGGEVIGL